MKKIKLLVPLMGLTAISGAIIPLASCSNTSSGKNAHINSVDKKVKTADEENKVTYYITLDKNTYLKQDINVDMVYEKKNDFSIDWLINESVLTVNVKYLKEVNEDQTINFDLTVKTNGWTETIKDFEIQLVKQEDPVYLCTLTFDSMGGSSVNEIKVVYGETATQPAAPTYEGYEFAGWYLDQNTQFDWTKPVKASYTLYARWTEISTSASVTFNYVLEGMNPYVVPVVQGETVNKPTTPTKQGWFFDCWCSDEQLQNEFDFNTPITQDTTLYARWIEDKFDLTFTYNEELDGYCVENDLDRNTRTSQQAPAYGVVTIPDHIDDGVHGEKPVVCIGDPNKTYTGPTIGAFQYINATGFIIPDTIKRICDLSFNYCFNIKTINSTTEGEYIIPESVTYIGNSVFTGNNNMKWFTFPSNLEYIGNYVFTNCNNIEYKYSGDNSELQYIPNGKSGNAEYNEHYYLNCYPNGQANWKETETIHDDCKIIGGFAFSSNDCSDKIVHIILPDDVRIICGSAFGGSSKLEDIKILNQTSPDKTIVLPQSLKSLGSFALSGVGSYNAIDLSRCTNLTKIEEGCFSRYQLSTQQTVNSIKLSDSIEKIGLNAFWEMDISTFNISKGVKSIDGKAFNGCQNLNTFTLDSQNTALYVSNDGKQIYKKGESGDPEDLLVYINKSSTATFEPTIKTIGNNAFVLCLKTLTSVTIPNTVIEIKDSAFSNCVKIASLDFEDNSQLQTIGKEAFDTAFDENSPSINITIPKSVETIKDNAFTNAHITSINFEDGDKQLTLGKSIFYCTSYMKNVTFKRIKTIPKRSFYQCTNLTTISIPEGVEEIEDTIIESCGITSIAFPSTLKKIGYCAFNSCSSLNKNNITFDPSATSWTVTKKADREWTGGENTYEIISEDFDPTDPNNVDNIYTYLTYSQLNWSDYSTTSYCLERNEQ